ncbi:unnamed protein product [Orchesella dallaii]|uniref:Fructose-2,6-bisphosphatase TIGAR n=1 Tax=Orchesella dallaii TaxID=48710 RepID=A0ABP1R2W4_9HEXA
MPCCSCSGSGSETKKKKGSLSTVFVVTFVRHGETKTNVEQIIQGRGPGELTTRGIHMSEILGKSLKDEVFTRAYNSDLKRTQDTLTHIMKHLRRMPATIIPNPILRERDFGDLEGQPDAKIFEIAVHNPTPASIHNLSIPGGESYEETMDRCAQFFHELCEMADRTETATENILVVTHGVWLMCFMDWLVECDEFQLINVDGFKYDSFPGNTAVTKIIIENAPPGKRKIEFLKLHDTSHLIS